MKFNAAKRSNCVAADVERSLLLPSATKLRRLCFYRCVSVHRGAVSQHTMQVVSKHALQQVSGGVVSQHALKGEGVPALGGVPGPRGCLVWGCPLKGAGRCLVRGGGTGLGWCLVQGGGWWWRLPPPPAYGYCCGRYASYWNAFLCKYASHLHTRSLYMAVIKTDNALTVKVT